MKAKDWSDVIINAAGNDSQLQVLSRILEEQDQAKQLLRDKGYGCTGLSLLKIVKSIPENGRY